MLELHVRQLLTARCVVRLQGGRTLAASSSAKAMSMSPSVALFSVPRLALICSQQIRR